MTISRIRSTPGGTDRYGDPIDSTETTEVIPQAFTAPRRSSDTDSTGRDGIVVGLHLFMPHGYDLTRRDEVDVDGERYRIIGDIGRWTQPWTGWKAGQTCDLERAEG